MKKIALINYHRIYNINNNAFNPAIYPIGENLEYPIVTLRKLLLEKNIELCTLDSYNMNDFDGAIFLDYPHRKDEDVLSFFKNKNKKIFLITLESPIIRPKNFKTNKVSCFDIVFTWNSSFKQEKVVYIKLPNKIPDTINFDIKKPRKFCTMISGNKKKHAKGELYTERRKALRWFEKNAPNDFDLYGLGWDKDLLLFPFPFSVIRKISFMKPLLHITHTTYRGKVNKKIDVLSNYKFAICYENVKGWNGYISEKIFDAFFAGAIPIYLGDNDPATAIPKDTYIDKSNFSTYSELYQYLKNMDNVTYLNYINAIKKFVEEEHCNGFNANSWGETISKHIVKMF